MKTIYILIFIFYTFICSGQKYYNHHFDFEGYNVHEVITNMDLYEDKLIAIAKISKTPNPYRFLIIDLTNPKNYTYNTIESQTNYFYSSYQGFVADSKGNSYAFGKIYDSLNICTYERFKVNGELDWHLELNKIYFKINSIFLLTDNYLVMSVQKKDSIITNDHLIWIDSSGTIIKEADTSPSGFKYNQEMNSYIFPDSSFLKIAVVNNESPIPNINFINIRKIDKVGNQVWSTTALPNKFQDGLGSLSKNGNIVIIKATDSTLNDNGNKIYYSFLTSLFNKEGIFLSSHYKSVYDSCESTISNIFPLKNGDHLLVGNAYCKLKPKDSQRGLISRLTHEGNLKWIRYIYETGMEYFDVAKFDDVLELENGDLIIKGFTKDPDGDSASKIWLLKTDSLGCVIPGCSGNNIVLETPTSTIVNEKVPTSYFVVFPNPSFNDLKIRLNLNVQNASIKLIDPYGKLLYESKILNTNNEITIPTKSISTGIYFIQYISNGKVLQIQKFIKQ